MKQCAMPVCGGGSAGRPTQPHAWADLTRWWCRGTPTGRRAHLLGTRHRHERAAAGQLDRLLILLQRERLPGDAALEPRGVAAAGGRGSGPRTGHGAAAAGHKLRCGIALEAPGRLLGWCHFRRGTVESSRRHVRRARGLRHRPCVRGGGGGGDTAVLCPRARLTRGGAAGLRTGADRLRHSLLRLRRCVRCSRFGRRRR